MQEKYRKHMIWWLDEFSAGSQVDHYVELFPELDSRLAKFAVGIFIWNMQGLIDINNPDDVNRVRQILKLLDRTPGYDFFDNVFNEADPDTVCGVIGMSSLKKADEDEIEFDYSVSPIKTYDEAHRLYEAASWDIVVSEESFNTHIANGNRFYFCENENWWDVPCIPGKGFPRDKFGYSLIAVEITPDNKIASVTSRWNTYGGKTGEFLSPQELRTVLGKTNFIRLFKSKRNKAKDKDTI